MESWSDIPDDIIEYILQKLDTPTDLLNLAAVCKSWRSVAVQNYNRFPQKLPICHFLPKACPLPMLLVPFGNGVNRRPYLYDIITEKTYKCFSASIFRNKWIPGSTRGWLVTVDTKDKSMNLLNPLTAKQIPLPHLSTFDKPFDSANHHEIDKCWYVEKATIFFDASGKPENSVIVAVVSTTLRICSCRVGDDKWTTVERSPVHIRDVINFKGKLYAVDFAGRLYAINIWSHKEWTLVAGRLETTIGSEHCSELYLVESSKKILLIARGSRCVGAHSHTTSFRVYGLVKSSSGYEVRYTLEDQSRHRMNNIRFRWVELETISEQTIFLGFNHSLSLDSRSNPNCRGNCIYFADNVIDQDVGRFFFSKMGRMPHDIGIYHVQDKKVESLAGLERLPSHHALWLSPSVQ